MKAQKVRLLDVFVLGPFMIWAGYEIGKQKELAGLTMIGAGIATVVYNWENYKKVQSNATIKPK